MVGSEPFRYLGKECSKPRKKWEQRLGLVYLRYSKDIRSSWSELGREEGDGIRVAIRTSSCGLVGLKQVVAFVLNVMGLSWN
jgi:hypothetical protein